MTWSSAPCRKLRMFKRGRAAGGSRASQRCAPSASKPAMIGREQLRVTKRSSRVMSVSVIRLHAGMSGCHPFFGGVRVDSRDGCNSFGRSRLSPCTETLNCPRQRLKAACSKPLKRPEEGLTCVGKRVWGLCSELVQYRDWWCQKLFRAVRAECW